MKLVLLASNPQVRRVIEITNCPVVAGTAKLLYLLQYLRSYYPSGTPMYLINYNRKSGAGTGSVDVTSSFTHLLGLSPFWNHVFRYRGVLVEYQGKNIFYDVSLLTEIKPVIYTYSYTDDSRSDYDEIVLEETPTGTVVKKIHEHKPFK